MAPSTSVLSDSETNVLGVPSLSEIPLSLSHNELVHQQCNDLFFVFIVFFLLQQYSMLRMDTFCTISCLGNGFWWMWTKVSATGLVCCACLPMAASISFHFKRFLHFPGFVFPLCDGLMAESQQVQRFLRAVAVWLFLF